MWFKLVVCPYLLLLERTRTCSNVGRIKSFLPKMLKLHATGSTFSPIVTVPGHGSHHGMIDRKSAHKRELLTPHTR